MAGRMSLGRRFDELDPAYCIEGGYNLARDLLEGAPVATGNYPAIFVWPNQGGDPAAL